MAQLYVHLLNITDAMYIQQMRELVLTPIQNAMGISKQITILILHQVSSKLVTPLKFIYSSI
jgi:hypothetical protein